MRDAVRPVPGDLDALLDELYGLPLERFVPERSELARSLRAAGRREEAAKVAGLAKPSVGAWAVNQVVRAQPDEAGALWAAGDAVLDAQARVVAGEGSGADLRAAVEEERRALAPLADAARGLLTGSGRFLGEQHVRVVVETLHAAAVDPESRAEVARGRLARPLEFAGVGAAAGAGGPAPRSGGAPTREPDRHGPSGRGAPDPDAQAARRRAERDRRARRDELRRALVRAQRDRDAARDRIAAGVRERDAALGGVEQARRALAAAEERLARTERQLGAAHEALERAEDAVEAAARAGVER